LAGQATSTPRRPIKPLPSKNKFPVPWCREFRCKSLDWLVDSGSHSAAACSPKHNSAKFTVNSQLAGNLGIKRRVRSRLLLQRRVLANLTRSIRSPDFFAERASGHDACQGTCYGPGPSIPLLSPRSIVTVCS